MGANDDRDCLECVDRYLVNNIDHGLQAAINQQFWGPDAQNLLTIAWRKATGLEPGWGYIQRGFGWRVWLKDETVLDSVAHQWADVPDGQIVLGVSYCGPLRFMAQGPDPYWLDVHGLLHDNRSHKGLCLRDPKMGIWVTDEWMREFRWRACLAFRLDG